MPCNSSTGGYSTASSSPRAQPRRFSDDSLLADMQVKSESHAFSGINKSLLNMKNLWASDALQVVYQQQPQQHQHQRPTIDGDTDSRSSSNNNNNNNSTPRSRITSAPGANREQTECLM